MKLLALTSHTLSSVILTNTPRGYLIVSKGECCGGKKDKCETSKYDF